MRIALTRRGFGGWFDGARTGTRASRQIPSLGGPGVGRMFPHHLATEAPVSPYRHSLVGVMFSAGTCY
jgi:hypothetical protein